MTDTVGIAGERILSFIERIERVEEELQQLNEDKKDIFLEAKGEGFDVKILKEILKLRKQDKDERDEHEVIARPLPPRHRGRRHTAGQGRVTKAADAPAYGACAGHRSRGQVTRHFAPIRPAGARCQVTAQPLGYALRRP